ncbi:MAG: lysophospholipid acyltransferase family protein [Xanthomonadales bacterium]|nr:lysophospholipid acyltransferase family protein [Xanthomonadales bacterium]
MATDTSLLPEHHWKGLPPLQLPCSRKARVGRFILNSLGKLPLWLNHGVASVIGTIIFCLPLNYRNNARDNLKRCFPEYGPLRRSFMLLRTMQETAKNFAEMGYLWARPPRKVLAKIREIQGEHLLDQAVASGRPILFGAPHLGAWELLSIFLASRTRISSLYRARKDAGLDRLILDARCRFGANMISTDAAGIRSLIKHLRAGETIGILPDHRPQSQQGVYAPFFGHPAYTATLFPKLCQRYKPVVLCGFARRLSFGRGYCIHICEPGPEIYSSDEQESAAALNATIETLARSAVSQYQWTYQRFTGSEQAGQSEPLGTS